MPKLSNGTTRDPAGWPASPVAFGISRRVIVPMRRLWIVGTFTLMIAFSALGALAATSLTPDLQDAHWIWLEGFEETPNATVYLARAFNLSSAPDEAVVRITCDSHYKMWINGTFAAETLNPGSENPGSQAWKSADKYDITDLLDEGDNYIVVQAVNHDGKGALLARALVRAADGSIHSFSTDSSWQAASEPGPNWQSTSEGGTWQAVVRGFLQLRAHGANPTFTPQLPVRWKSVKLNIMHRGQKYRVTVKKDGAVVRKV